MLDMIIYDQVIDYHPTKTSARDYNGLSLLPHFPDDKLINNTSSYQGTCLRQCMYIV